MRRALELARRAWGRTHPNPMVGAVITEGGVIVAEGFHAAAGQPHAEVMAMRALGRVPQADAILHVTLEPCCTHGRTPPCVDAILRAGFRTVVVGATDPNPAHAGKGIDRLRQAGVAVVEGVLRDECTDLNFLFNHWITAARPLLALKIAATLDGKLVPAAGEPRAITGPAAQTDVHRWRRLFPAIAVTADTLLADNPRLTARDADGEHAPVRFVLDRHFRSAGRAGLNLFTDAFRGRTIVVGLASAVRAADLAWFEAEGIQVWSLPGDGADFLDAWAERGAAEGITGVLIEAGPRFASVLLREGVADYLFAYIAPRLGGDPESPAWFEGGSFPLVAETTSLFGQDALFRGYLG